MTNVKVLITLVVLEAVVIYVLLWRSFRVVLQPTIKPVSAEVNPLQTALRYDASEKKFEEIVSAYPDWIYFRGSDPNTWNYTILESCAILNKTNYVRILIRHGANVDEAIKTLSRPPSFTNAVNLLRAVQVELKSHPAVGKLDSTNDITIK